MNNPIDFRNVTQIHLAIGRDGRVEVTTWATGRDALQPAALTYQTEKHDTGNIVSALRELLGRAR